MMFKKLQYWLLPTFCLLCHTKTLGDALCSPCFEELPWQVHNCVRCGLSLSETQICGECAKNPPPYDHTVCLFDYQTPIAQLILSLKFAGKLAYAKLLGELMTARIAQHYQTENIPELIIPVPLHVQRLKERGYNQALEIARPIAKQLKMALDVTSCVRVLPTLPQAMSQLDTRKQNMKDAFEVKQVLQAKHVAIIDDVVTTGSTVAELASVLKKAGVARVDVWCCARTQLRTMTDK